MSDLDVQIPTAFGMPVVFHPNYHWNCLHCLECPAYLFCFYIQTPLPRRMLGTLVQLPDQKTTFMYASSSVMVARAWPLSRVWRRSSATARSSKTSRKSFAAMVQLSRTQNLDRCVETTSKLVLYHVHLFRNFLMQARCLDHCCSFPLQVIQLQGDQRKNVSNFLVQVNIFLFILCSVRLQFTNMDQDV